MKSFFTDKQWRWVADRYREGYPIGDLAVFLGIYRNSVRRGLIRIGCIPENRKNLPPLSGRKAEFIRLNPEFIHLNRTRDAAGGGVPSPDDRENEAGAPDA